MDSAEIHRCTGVLCSPAAPRMKPGGDKKPGQLQELKQLVWGERETDCKCHQPRTVQLPLLCQGCETRAPHVLPLTPRALPGALRAGDAAEQGDRAEQSASAPRTNSMVSQVQDCGRVPGEDTSVAIRLKGCSLAVGLRRVRGGY